MATGDVVKLGGFYLNSALQPLPTRPWYGQPQWTTEGKGNIPIFSSGSVIEVRDTPPSDASKIQWVEVIDGSKKYLIADRVLLFAVSWDDLNAQGLITGKQITIDGTKYLLRAIDGGSSARNTSNADLGGAPNNNEWDKFISNELLLSGLPIPTSADLSWASSNSVHNQKWNWLSAYSYAQGKGVYRGYNSARYFGVTSNNARLSNSGWRPVLEVLNSAPTIPTNLSASGSIKPGGTVTLTTGGSTDSDGDAIYYQYQYTPDGGYSWTTINMVNRTSIDFVIPSGYTASYIQFRVRAYDRTEYSDYRNSTEYTITYNTAPTTPTTVYIEGSPRFLTKGLTYKLNFVGSTDADGDKLTYYVDYLDGVTWRSVAVTTETSAMFTVPLTHNATFIAFRASTYDGSLYSPSRTSVTYSINNKTEITLTTVNELIEINEGDNIILSGTAKDVDSNQAVTVYYEIGNSGERIITASTSGASFPYTKTLTFTNNSIIDGGSKVTENVVAGSKGSVTLKVYAKDSEGAVSDVITKTLTMSPNQNPVITLDTNSIVMGEGAVKEITATTTDKDVDAVKLVVQLRGQATKYEIPLGTSNGVSVLTNKFSINSYGSILYLGVDRLKPLSPEKLSTGVHYLDVTAIDEHGGTSDVKTITVTFTANRKPIVNVSNAPAIIPVNVGKHTFTGTVTDLDTYDKSYLTFGVRVNGKEIVNIPLGENGAFSYDFAFKDSEVGVKSLVFIANDGKENSSVTKEFEVVDDRILFKFKNPIDTDLAVTRVNVLLGYHISDDAVLKVEVCNNGYDASPKWEDITELAINNSPYTFVNKTKTASKWGLNMRVEIVKNSAPTVYVDRIGILFE